MNNRTRYKLTLLSAIFLALVTLLAIYSKMEAVATASIAGIMTILSAYIWSQTSRPSLNEHAQKKTRKRPTAKNSITAIFSERDMDPLEK
jgi:hypothetical protein